MQQVIKGSRGRLGRVNNLKIAREGKLYHRNKVYNKLNTQTEKERGKWIHIFVWFGSRWLLLHSV